MHRCRPAGPVCQGRLSAPSVGAGCRGRVWHRGRVPRVDAAVRGGCSVCHGRTDGLAEGDGPARGVDTQWGPGTSGRVSQDPLRCPKYEHLRLFRRAFRQTCRSRDGGRQSRSRLRPAESSRYVCRNARLSAQLPSRRQRVADSLTWPVGTGCRTHPPTAALDPPGTGRPPPRTPKPTTTHTSSRRAPFQGSTPEVVACGPKFSLRNPRLEGLTPETGIEGVRLVDVSEYSGCSRIRSNPSPLRQGVESRTAVLSRASCPLGSTTRRSGAERTSRTAARTARTAATGKSRRGACS